MRQITLIIVLLLFHEPEMIVPYKSSKNVLTLLRDDNLILTFDYEINEIHTPTKFYYQFQKVDKVLKINFRFNKDIAFPQYVNVTYGGKFEQVIFEFSEMDDYNVTCIDQYYASILTDQTPICTFTTPEVINEKAITKAKLTITVGTWDDNQELISKLPEQDQETTAFATIFDPYSSYKRVYNTTFILIWIDKTFPINFPYYQKILNVLDWVSVFKIAFKAKISKFLKDLTTFKVTSNLAKLKLNKDLESSWNCEKTLKITKNPQTHIIKILVKIKANSKTSGEIGEKIIFDSSYYLYFYHINESYLRNESANKLQNGMILCSHYLKDYNLSISLFNKNYSTYAKNFVIYFQVTNKWPEKKTVNFTCSFYSSTSYKNITNVILKNYTYTITKLTYDNCRFIPKFNVMFLPKVFQIICDCRIGAKFIHYDITGNCTRRVIGKCHYNFLCYSYNGLSDLKIKINIKCNDENFIIDRRYQKVSLPWYMSYLPPSPNRNEIISCITNVRYLNLIFHWHCSVSIKVDPLEYNKYYFTNGSQLKFSLYAPDLVHMCICNVFYKNETGFLHYNISKRFYIMLRENRVERCELQMDLQKPISLAMAYMGMQIIVFILLLLIFPLIAYHMTDKYNFNLKRKQILMSLGIREIIDFNKTIFKPLHISKWRVSAQIYNSILNLSIEASKKAEILRNFRDKMSALAEKAEEPKDDNVDNKKIDKDEMQSIIRRSMRLSQSEMEQIYLSKKIQESIKKRKSINSKDSKKKLKSSLKVRLEYKPKTNNIAKLIKLMEENDEQEMQKKREKKQAMRKAMLSDNYSIRSTDSILKDIRSSNSGVPKLRFTLSKESENVGVKSSITKKPAPFGVYESAAKNSDVLKFDEVRNILFPKRSSSDEAISQHRLYRKNSSLSGSYPGSYLSSHSRLSQE